jgi:hypothetical protein
MVWRIGGAFWNRCAMALPLNEMGARAVFAGLPIPPASAGARAPAAGAAAAGAAR